MGLLSALGRRGMRSLQSGEMFGRASPNTEALQLLASRIRQRGPEFGGDDVETYKALLLYGAPGMRRNPRLQSARSLEELGQVLDEAGVDPNRWIQMVGI